MNGDKHRVLCGLAVAVIFGVLAFGPPVIRATPFTDHFDALIVDLQTRAAGLSNSVDKTEQKQFKAIQKVLATLEAKDSPSLATDIKNLGKIAKSLLKVFPPDFPAGSLATDLQSAVDGMTGDVQDNIDSTQTTIDGLPAGSCKDKANAALAAAQDLLDSVGSAPDFPTAAKLLGSALKAATKASAAAAKCLNSGGGGGGNGDSMDATVTGTISASFHAIFPSATYDTSTGLYNLIGGDANGIGIDLVVSNVVGNGSYPLLSSTTLTESSNFDTFQGGAGTITFTTIDFVQNRLAGSFSFTAPQVFGGAGSVTVSSGSFNMPVVVVTPP